MKKRRRRSVGPQIIVGMKDFVKKLEDGVPIEATRIRRVETPAGPMHIRENVVLNTSKAKSSPPPA